MKRNKSLVVFVLCIIFLLAFSTVLSAKIPNDTLVIAANTGIFITLDPGVVYEVLPGKIVDALYAKLVDLSGETGTLTPKPVLAERWEISENKMEYTFYLKKGLKFANGDPLTVNDVEWSVKRYLNLDAPSVWLLESIGINKGNMGETIKVFDDYTIRFIFDKPYASNIILGILTNQFSGVVNSKLVMKNEKDGDYGKEYLNDHSAGAGPYVLERWERNNIIELRANPNYVFGEPAIKRIIVQDVPEASNQRLYVEKGDADVAWNLTGALLKEMEGKPGVKIVTVPGHGNEYLAMNAQYGPLANADVRLAIKWAINYEEIVEKVLDNYALLVQGFINKGYFAYVPENPFKQDIVKAKALLAKAGYPDGFEVELITSNTDERKAEAEKVQADLAKAGIKVNIIIMQSSQMYALYRAQSHQMVIAGWGNDFTDPDNLAQSHANYRAKQLAWRNMWYDDWAADITEKAQVEPDPEKRIQMYKELTEYWFQNGPFALFYQTIEKWAIREEVKGFEAGAFGYGMVFDFTKIYK